MADWTTLNYVVVDVEGNGQQPPELVELAVVPIVNGVIGEPTTWLVRPEHPIKHFATRIHGLSTKDVAGAPQLAEVQDQVLAALGGGALVAHNAHVDVGVLTRQLKGWEPAEVFDTLKLARRLVPGQPSYKLGALVQKYGLDEGPPDGLVPHRATYDALMAARLFVRLATQVAETPLSVRELRGEAPDEPEALF